MPDKLIVLLRHGESAAQAHRGKRSDAVLRDCGLSRKGEAQARAVDASPFLPAELVVSSPLTRALLTAAALRFGAPVPSPIVVHPHLRELGSGIPENQPRPAADVLCEPGLRGAALDLALLPPAWPDDANAGANGPARLAELIAWLGARPERVIWVVCHHNAIQHLLRMFSRNGVVGRVANCAPIACTLRGGALLSHGAGGEPPAAEEPAPVASKALRRPLPKLSRQNRVRLGFATSADAHRAAFIAVVERSAAAIITVVHEKLARNNKSRRRAAARGCGEASSGMFELRRLADGRSKTLDSCAAQGGAGLDWLCEGDLIFVQPAREAAAEHDPPSACLEQLVA